MSHTADQLEGFEDLLEAAGRVFPFGSEQFRGLVKTKESVAEDYDLGAKAVCLVGYIRRLLALHHGAGAVPSQTGEVVPEACRRAVGDYGCDRT